MSAEEQLADRSELEAEAEGHASSACVNARGRSSSGLCGVLASVQLALRLAASESSEAAESEELLPEAADGAGKSDSSSSASARARA